LKNKAEFYIAFYEQLALKGFQAYKPSYDYDKKFIADICADGFNIAHLTKADVIEPNPHAEGVKAETIEKIRKIFKDTMEMCGLVDVRRYFSETDLSVIHASLIKVRMSPDNDLNSQETAEIDALIDKIENIVPETNHLTADFEYENTHNGELAEGVEV